MYIIILRNDGIRMHWTTGERETQCIFQPWYGTMRATLFVNFKEYPNLQELISFIAPFQHSTSYRGLCWWTVSTWRFLHEYELKCQEKSKFYKFISKRWIISLMHKYILRRIWLHFMAYCFVFKTLYNQIMFRISSCFGLSFIEETQFVEMHNWNRMSFTFQPGTSRPLLMNCKYMRVSTAQKL
jgi:hypothetical protein